MKKNSFSQLYRAPVINNKFSIKPFSKLLRISYCCRQSDYLRIREKMFEDGDDYLQCRASLYIIQCMNFVDNYAFQLAYPRRVMPDNRIKFFSSCNNQVILIKIMF